MTNPTLSNISKPLAVTATMLRVYHFAEFDGLLPEEAMRDYCASNGTRFTTVKAEPFVGSAKMQAGSREYAIVRSNAKVFFPVSLQDDDAFVCGIALLFERAGFSVKRPMRDRLVCTTALDRFCVASSSDLSTSTAAAASSQCAWSRTSSTSSSLADCSFVSACAAERQQFNSGTAPHHTTGQLSSDWGGMMGRLGDRTVPVDNAEHESNLSDPDMQIQCVEPGLFIGPYVALCDAKTLSVHGITHAINASQRTSVVATTLCGLKVLDIDVVDASSSDIMKHLPGCRAFIARALLEGGTVLVNCFAGVSRSASIVIDWWMHRDHLTFRMARNKLRAIRTCIKPNGGFRTQLERHYRLENARKKPTSRSQDVDLASGRNNTQSKC